MREIVIELERIQKVRRKAAVASLFCVVCSMHSDFVSLSDAERLFDLTREELLGRFIRSGVHTQRTADDERICVNSLFDFINRRGHLTGRLNC